MSTVNASRARYDARIKAVENYIHAHLDEAIDLNRLADIACLSPYHWHRVYHAIQGETVHATLSRLRLQHAAQLLTSTDEPLKQIARRAGYSGAPPFSRAFKAAYGASPIQYRNTGPHTRYRPASHTEAGGSLEVIVRDQPEYQCVAVPHTGRYTEVDRAFSALFRHLGAAGLMTGDVPMIGVYFDDPSLVDDNKLESLACAAGIREEDLPNELTHWRIPGGEHAILRHRGPYDGLEAAYDWLFGHWLTGSGRDAADEPVYEIYLNNPRETAPKDLLVDICLPLVSAGSERGKP